MALCTGFGLGYAASNCQHDFRRVDSVHLRPLKVTTISPCSLDGTQAALWGLYTPFAHVPNVSFVMTSCSGQLQIGSPTPNMQYDNH